MLPSYVNAEQRYDELRKSALKSFENSFSESEKGILKARTITTEALHASTAWDTVNTRRVGWDWVNEYSAFKFRHPKRFEMALWQNDKLISLSLGRPTYAGTALRLDLVEASPKELGDRVNVITFVLASLEIYARVLEARQIRIMHPINETVRDYYASFGYTYTPKGDYLYQELL
jgi:hypothetical protein